MNATVIRTDLMSGTNQPADLVSLRFYDGEDKQGRCRKRRYRKSFEGYEDGEREVMKAVAASSTDDLNDCAIVAALSYVRRPSVIWTRRVHQ